MCVCVVGIYPTDQSEYPSLRSAVEKLTLNDSSVMVQRDSSLALGAGWRSGFNMFTFTYLPPILLCHNRTIMVEMQQLYHENSPLDLFCSLRLGFLGLLHMEVFNQRLEQEYNASVIVTAPTVPYKAVLASPKLIKV